MEAALVLCTPNLLFKPAFIINDFTHLDTVCWETALWGCCVLINNFGSALLKTAVRWRYSFKVWTIHCFWFSLYSFSTIHSKWCPGFDCFNKWLGWTRQVSSLNSMSSVWIKCNVWHRCAVNKRKSMHNLQDNWNKVVFTILLMYERTILTSPKYLYIWAD